MMDLMVPIFIGRIVTLITSAKPEELFAQSWHVLAGMAAILLLARPLSYVAQHLIMNQAIAANVANRIRWQNHWHVVRQSWTFFQNDFAGRIANRVMQTGPAMRESLVALLTAVWFIIVYGTSALVLLASADLWLALPVTLWFFGYIAMLTVFVPRMRDRSKVVSEARSALTGRIVDSYTNILTVKLFARAQRGRRLCARGGRLSHRPLLFAAAAEHAVRVLADVAQCAADDRHRRVRHRAVAARAYRRRHGRDGAADDDADHQRRPAGSRGRSPASSRTSASCRKA